MLIHNIFQYFHRLHYLKLIEINFVKLKIDGSNNKLEITDYRTGAHQSYRIPMPHYPSRSKVGVFTSLKSKLKLFDYQLLKTSRCLLKYSVTLLMDNWYILNNTIDCNLEIYEHSNYRISKNNYLISLKVFNYYFDIVIYIYYYISIYLIKPINTGTYYM